MSVKKHLKHWRNFTILVDNKREVVLKPQIRLKGKTQSDPPSPKSYGRTGEKAQSAIVLCRTNWALDEALKTLLG
jgi:hypothetical protein